MGLTANRIVYIKTFRNTQIIVESKKKKKTPTEDAESILHMSYANKNC